LTMRSKSSRVGIGISWPAAWSVWARRRIAPRSWDARVARQRGDLLACEVPATALTRSIPGEAFASYLTDLLRQVACGEALRGVHFGGELRWRHTPIVPAPRS
jgi:hypothetical protein